MATIIPAHPTSHNVAALLPKLQDADSDFRFMSLNDLHAIFSTASSSLLMHDPGVAARAVEGILKALDDQNGEVQNLAVKCLAALVLIVPPGILPPLIEKLSNLTTQNAVDTSIPSTALRTVVANLPRPSLAEAPSQASEEAYSAISKVLIPRLVGYNVTSHESRKHTKLPPGMLEVREGKGVDPDAVDVLIEVVRCFGPRLQVSEVSALYEAVTKILDDGRSSSVVKKRAIVALSVLVIYFSDALLSSFVSRTIEVFRDPHLSPSKRRLSITITGAIARSIPPRFGPYLKTLTPFILSAVSEGELSDQMEDAPDDNPADPEIDEVREAALSALESFLAFCSGEMRMYTREVIRCALVYLKYDPNFAHEDNSNQTFGGSGEDGEDTNEFDDEEDFEEEGGFSDDEDISWKVRRCAAKLLYTLISTRANADLLDDLYQQVAPVLIERFSEREENVRLEILATMGLLIRKTGEGAVGQRLLAQGDGIISLGSQAQSRKRRRGGSDTSGIDSQTSLTSSSRNPFMTSTALSGPRAMLAKLSPAILRSLASLLRVNSLATKQASICLLRDIVAVQEGGLSDHLDQVVDLIAESIRGSSAAHGGTTFAASTASVSAATASSLRIEALKLAAAIAETHQSSLLQKSLERLVPGVAVAVRDRFYKVATEALNAVEQFVKASTPPRSQLADEPQRRLLEQLYDVIVDRITANDGDAEVRQRALHALGVQLARSSGPQGARFLTPEKREFALNLISDRLKNEVTRLAAIRAIDIVATYTSAKSDFSPAWVKEVAVELGAQLRKASRSVRGASLETLKDLIESPAGQAHLDSDSAKILVGALSPLLTANDLHLLGPSLAVLSDLVRGGGGDVIDSGATQAICSLTRAQLSGAVLDALLNLVKTIGEHGVGAPLMQGLLKDVGVNGDATLVGKAIGTLLVAGGPNIGVRLQDFVDELKNAQDDQRKCLALSVLGEAGLRLGPSSPLEANLFMGFFKSKSDKVPLAAAVALGRAGAGNVHTYVPIILQALTEAGGSQYLLLHSVKEILQHASDTSTDISRYSQQIWDKLLLASQEEDNKAVGAECIGRLIIADPKNHLPSVQTYLKDNRVSVRGIMIQALRYALTDTDDSYDILLQAILPTMLTTMLNDSDLENARLALTTLNSAVNNKPHLILPYLGQLLPPVMRESVIKPELIREVQMGPFKHKVDDGLELRKSAYETLYALMESAFSSLDTAEFFDRVIAGLEDEHDIRVLCNLMLAKLVALEPDETLRRLDQIAERFRAILSYRPKEHAVKQEIEKADEATKGVLKVSAQLRKAFPNAGGSAVSGQNQIWRNYWEWVKKEYSSQMRAIEEEKTFRDE